MAANIERFRNELTALIKESGRLFTSAQRYAFGTKFDDNIKKAFSEDTAKLTDFLNNLPDFRPAYEAWYSESLRVVMQLLPDRVADFRSQYEVTKSRKNIANDNYTIHDMIHGLTSNYGQVEISAGLPCLEFQINILKSAERRFESALFEMRQLVQADLFDNEIDAARELLRNKFVRAAGAVAGVVLERHLKLVCDDHSIKLTKSKPTLSVLNDALKDASVIDVPQWRFNQHLGDIRNNCDHARQPDPTAERVQELLDGTAKVLKTIS